VLRIKLLYNTLFTHITPLKNIACGKCCQRCYHGTIALARY